MSVCVLLYKKTETEDYVEYGYGPNDEFLGRLRLNKANGEYEVLEDVPGIYTNEFYLFRALKRLEECRQSGIFPVKTSFG